MKDLYTKKSMKESFDEGFYYIAYYGGGTDSGFIGYDGEPTINIDDAMQFDSEKEAERKRKILQKEWIYVELRVEYFSLDDEFEESKNRKSMKESKKSFEEFEDICYDNFSFAIDHTYEHKGDYFVVVYGDERQTEKFAKILRNNGFEATWYRLDDPHNECYLCYEIMAF